MMMISLYFEVNVLFSRLILDEVKMSLLAEVKGMLNFQG